jgi:hypothetical protein
VEWNRVRWQAVQDLLKNDVPAADIDGGFSLREWFLLYDRNYLTDAVRPDPRWPTYLIGPGEIPGYTVVRKYPYRHWLPSSAQEVVVYRQH